MATPVLPRHRDLFYGGAWHAPVAGRRAPSIDPATGETLCEVAQADAEDAARAVAAAAAAFPAWRATRPLERAAKLREVAAILRAHAEELALLDAADCGNPVREMLGDVAAGAAGCDYFAGLVTELKGETVPLGEAMVNYTVREPLGVVARIIPYNHPIMFAAVKSAGPLAAGNTVVLKPPEQAPLSSLRLAELIADVLPPGVLNVLPGGREAGAALAAHPKVAKVALIGSVPTGRAVLHAAADTIKPVGLELGGKNALIVFPDADPDKAAAGAVRGMNFTWAGQSCGSTSRAFLHDTVHDRVLAGIVAGCAAYRPGLPAEMGCTMGALVSREQRDKVLRYIAWGKEDGARLVAGGGPPDDPRLANGFFVEPTVFADVTPEMRIAREEIFGPVLSILPYKDEADAIRIANDHMFGLAGYVHSADRDRAKRVARQIRAGMVTVNMAVADPAAPFGGYRQSGNGREWGRHGIEEYLETKAVMGWNAA